MREILRFEKSLQLKNRFFFFIKNYIIIIIFFIKNYIIIMRLYTTKLMQRILTSTMHCQFSQKYTKIFEREFRIGTYIYISANVDNNFNAGVENIWLVVWGCDLIRYISYGAWSRNCSLRFTLLCNIPARLIFDRMTAGANANLTRASFATHNSISMWRLAD